MDFVSDPDVLRVPSAPDAQRTGLDQEDLALMDAATLLVMSTVDTDGVSCSQRGGPAGTLLHRAGPRTLWIPDAVTGRLHQSVRNVVTDERIGILLMAPGRHDALRIRGHAQVTIDPHAIAAFDQIGLEVRSVVVMSVADVRRSGSGPLRRAGLWPADQV